MSLFNKKKPEHVVKKSVLRGTFIPKKKTAVGCYRTMKDFRTIPGIDQWVEDAEFETENEAWEAIKKKRVF